MRLDPLSSSLVTALALVAAGCGGDDDGGTAEPAPATTATTAGEAGDAANGKEVFATAGCGGCHTFSAAGSSGSVGPNLDDLAPSFDAVVTAGDERRRRDAVVQGRPDRAGDPRRGGVRLRLLARGYDVPQRRSAAPFGNAARRRRRTYADRFVSDTVSPADTRSRTTLELLWQDDASAFALLRDAGR